MSGDSRYTVEFAKSARAACKKCKAKIEKGEIRLGIHGNNGQFEFVHWHHPACFSLPRKLSTGASKISPAQFVANLLEDATEGEILPAKAEELAEAIGSGGAAGGKKKGSGDDDAENPIADLKRAYEEQQNAKDKGDDDEDDDDRPKKKKAKKSNAKSSSSAAASAAVDPKRLEFYGEFKGMKVDELKDILRWNRQVLTGTKDFLLAKVIDGAVHDARLARCTLCGGRLKLEPDGKSVKCSGSFDEESQIRVDCAFSCSADDAPRWKPWFTEEPSEEEKEKMDALEEAAKGSESAKADAASDPIVAKLVQQASKLETKNLNTKDGLKQTVTALFDLLRNLDGESKTIDLPANDKAAKMKVGEVVARNRDKTVAELIPLLVEQFGFKETKKAKNSQREAAIEGMVKEPKNAPLVAAFQELSELYFKEGNRNAGASYTKAVNALKNLDFVVTADNAKGLGAGKNKIANIGKASADKMYEFVTTGTIATLEEKRANAA